MKKVCKICGKTFKTEYNYSKYCSDECRKIASNTRSLKWERDHPDEHRRAARLNMRKYRKRKTSPVYERECKLCGEHFTTTRSNKVFCCDTCRQRYWIIKKSGKDPQEYHRLSYEKCSRPHNGCETCEHEDCIFA